jgi:hypothetical protein
VGVAVGTAVGAVLGTAEGENVGALEGTLDGEKLTDGEIVGKRAAGLPTLGTTDGTVDGT